MENEVGFLPTDLQVSGFSWDEARVGDESHNQVFTIGRAEVGSPHRGLPPVTIARELLSALKARAATTPSSLTAEDELISRGAARIAIDSLKIVIGSHNAGYEERCAHNEGLEKALTAIENLPASELMAVATLGEAGSVRFAVDFTVNSKETLSESLKFLALRNVGRSDFVLYCYEPETGSYDPIGAADDESEIVGAAMDYMVNDEDYSREELSTSITICTAPTPSSSAAEIVAEMAREAATIAARHASNFRESGDDIDANLKECYEARANALREAERRIRAKKD